MPEPEIFVKRERLAAMEWSLAHPGQSRDEHQARVIMAEVAARFHVTLEDLVGPRKPAPLAFARQHAMLRVRRETRLSSVAIGRLFNREHSTILHGAAKAAEAETRRWA